MRAASSSLAKQVACWKSALNAYTAFASTVSCTIWKDLAACQTQHEFCFQLPWHGRVACCESVLKARTVCIRLTILQLHSKLWELSTIPAVQVG